VDKKIIKMTLKDNFFTIKSQNATDSNAEFRVKLNAENFVYQAHFPNNPITPGVCLVQMAVELFGFLKGKNFSIKTLKNVKFTAPVNPLEFPEIDFLINFTENENLWQVKVLIKEKEIVFAKISLVVSSEYSVVSSAKPNTQYSLLNTQYCVIIPVYNSEKHIANVLTSVLQHIDNVIVVNDGSTDGTLEAIKRNTFQKRVTFELVSYTKNRGKGYALQQGFSRALELGFTHAITMDADGQHLATDIATLVQTSEKQPNALIVGARKFDNPNMPQGNIFANNFSNFWFMVQTGKKLPDTQTGFRVYPLQKIGKMRLFTNRYEAELEMLVRSAWRNIPIISQPINVYYPPVNERLSHFRGGKDFFRISVLNTILCFVAVIYGYPSMFLRRLMPRIHKLKT